MRVLERFHLEVDRQQLLAAALVLLGAVLFSAKAIVVKLAYHYPVDSISLLALRMLFALPFYLAMAGWVRFRRKQLLQENPVRSRDWVWIALYGLAGYYLASLFDFLGLQYITAGLERLILFLYPTLVLVLSALFLRQRILRTQLIALVITYSGIFIAFLDPDVWVHSEHLWLGAGLIFLCSLTYAIYLMGSGTLIPRLGTLRYTSLAMSIACVGVLTHHGIVLHFRLFHFPAEVYYLALFMAVFSTVLPTFLIGEGIRVIGASNTSILGSIGPVATIVMAYFVLGESFGWWQLLGTVVVTGGVMYISLVKPR
ncbi:MAG: EamA family transporter [Lewinellaceae bacterium]|nr:EamA family transporter [Lewinellaceae bacterium]